MYTPPVPPVTMLRVLPVKFGVADAAALIVAPGVAVAVLCRGAAQAATSSDARTGTRSLFISDLPLNDGSLGRGGQGEARGAPLLGCSHAPFLLVGLGDDRRQRHRPAFLIDPDEDQVRGRDV